MNASYEWLREFADVALTPLEVRDALTARAATVDDVVPLRADLRAVVVARVVEAHRHPDSDHLWVTHVDAGAGEHLQVVCGAPNVSEGALYPFAPVGATLPGDVRIERRKIRGVVSNGMLCSARELGVGGDHEGILELHTSAAPGTPFLDAFTTGDVRLVVDVLPNRPDLLSHEGLARELAAFAGVPLRRPSVLDLPTPQVAFAHGVRNCAAGSEERTAATVTLDPYAACSRYIGLVIRGVTVAPSPDWLVRRLEAVGSRAINNVVDVTNYMLHAFGQPMHAFDLGRLSGSAVVVRPARPGEEIRTLDGVTRVLDATVTVIADERAPQAIAGVIGGATSEVGASTRDVFLEVAVFDPRSVRRTRRLMGVSTDASYRFERGVDTAALERRALDAAALIVSLAGGTVEPLAASVGEHPRAPAARRVRHARMNLLLGHAIEPDSAAGFLRSVGFTVVPEGRDAWLVTPPSWRHDVEGEADVAEEIARLQGYDAIPEVLRPFRIGTATDSPHHLTARAMTDALVGAGLYEVRPMPFVRDAGERGVAVINPLAESERMLRGDLLSTLARRVEYNFAHMVRDVRLFEVGVAFHGVEGTDRPAERLLAAAVVTGDRHPAHFTGPRPPQVDIWDARWVGELMARTAYGRDRAEFRPAPRGDGWTIVLDGSVVGRVCRVAVDAPVWAGAVYGVEVDLGVAAALARVEPRFTAVPSMPPAEFDLALLVPDGLPAARVEGVIRNAAGELLEKVVPFDEFRGAGVPEGWRSVAWRLTLRHPERTLRDREIDGRRARILRALDEELGVRPRAS